jgi:universal stress protein A
MRLYRRILHPTDFSAASRRAFECAVALARRDHAELSLLHVLSPSAPFVGDGYVTVETWQRIEAGARRAAESRMKVTLARARRAGGRASAMIVEGVAFERIVRTAKTKHADLIVIGTHGRTGISRFFIGSVAERVVRLAPCPVLTVRGR